MKMETHLLVAFFVALGMISAISQSNPSSTNATDVEMQLAWPDGTTYTSSIHDTDQSAYLGSGTGFWQRLALVMASPGAATWYYRDQWDEASGGSAQEKLAYQGYHAWGEPSDDLFFWGPSIWPEFDDGYYISLPAGSTNEAGPPFVDQIEYYGSLSFASSDGQSTLSVNDQAQVTLITGGDPGSTDTELYAITGNAMATTYSDQSGPFGFTSGVAPGQVNIGNLGSLTPVGPQGEGVRSGVLYATLPTHKKILITPAIAAPGSISANVSAQAYPLRSLCVATTPANRARETIGVGEQVILFSPGLATNAIWHASVGSLSTNYGITVLFTAPSNATCVKITAGVLGTTVSKSFTVVEPRGYAYAQVIGTNYYAVNVAGAGVSVTVFIGPTNVSFSRVWMEEIGEIATNATGYFSNTNLWPSDYLDHSQHGANQWFQLSSQNTWVDHAFTGSCPQPWSAGSFSWPIPVAWQVGGTSTLKTNYLTGWNQSFMIDSSGTATVQKFRRSLTRTINNVITIQ